MSEPQPTTGPGTPAKNRWRRRPGPKTLLATGGALTGLLLAAGFAFGGSDPPGELPAPPVVADPVPAAPLISSYRADCGVSRATLDALVPDPEQHQSILGDTCRWNTAGHDKERYLDVSITLVTEGRQTASGRPSTTPVTTAMSTFADQARIRTVKPKALRGLGDEAITYYSPKDRIGGGSRVLLRARNAIVTVTYRSGYRDKPPSEKTATDGAVRAATDVVRGLGVAVNQAPVVADIKAEAVPNRPPFKVCDMVSRGTRQELVEADGEVRGHARKDEIEKGKIADSCKWEMPTEGNLTYYLQVSLTALPSVESARNDYLKRHLEARAEEPISRTDEKYFAAVSGLGEQAYASYVEEGLPGGVVFRVRNVVATVVYTQETDENAAPGDSRPLTREQSVNGAYAAARDVANALRN